MSFVSVQSDPILPWIRNKRLAQLFARPRVARLHVFLRACHAPPPAPLLQLKKKKGDVKKPVVVAPAAGGAAAGAAAKRVVHPSVAEAKAKAKAAQVRAREVLGGGASG